MGSGPNAETLSCGVITVCKNSAGTIRRTIDSVFRQTVRPLQYVFVDGGSRDDTLSIVEAATTESERRRLGILCEVIHQHNEGITQAWNIGIHAMTADIVCILNSDDWYDHDTLEKVLARFARRHDAGIVLGSGRYFNGPGDTSPRICHPRPSFLLPLTMTVIHPACFVRREMYRRVGRYDEQYRIAADYDFVYRCHHAGVRFVRAPEVMVNVLRGGIAETNMALGWREVTHIGRRHAFLPLLPVASAIARRWLGSGAVQGRADD